MKKALGMLLALILVASVGVFALRSKGEALDKESKAFADDFIIKTVSSWDKEQLLSKASPEFMQALESDPAGFEKVFATWKKLGSLRKYEGSKGQTRIGVTQNGRQVLARYLAEVQFENSPARIALICEKRDGEWVVHKFHVDSKYFLQ